jgi:hypothetical protein
VNFRVAWVGANDFTSVVAGSGVHQYTPYHAEREDALIAFLLRGTCKHHASVRVAAQVRDAVQATSTGLKTAAKRIAWRSAVRQ